MTGPFAPALGCLLVMAMAAAPRAGGFDVAGTDLDALPMVADGFEVAMPAREPLVQNVSMLAFDARGRLFVGMGPQYRLPLEDTPGDRIVQLVDADGDGTFEAAKPFAGKLLRSPPGVLAGLADCLGRVRGYLGLLPLLLGPLLDGGDKTIALLDELA
jgi:hypothetical protein